MMLPIILLLTLFLLKKKDVEGDKVNSKIDKPIFSSNIDNLGINPGRNTYKGGVI